MQRFDSSLFRLKFSCLRHFVGELSVWIFLQRERMGNDSSKFKLDMEAFRDSRILMSSFFVQMYQNVSWISVKLCSFKKLAPS